MPIKPNTHKWNDVQTVIATTAIALTLGLWNLFATPTKPATAQVENPPVPPTEPALTTRAEMAPMPQVKIMFTQVAPQTITVSQQQQVQPQMKKKKKNNTNGGGQSVTQTKTS
jgi:hypothetical protein